MHFITVREYATKERITLGSAYRRIWEGRVDAQQLLGRWVINPNDHAGEVAPETDELARSDVGIAR
jgi:hypothetical protein